MSVVGKGYNLDEPRPMPTSDELADWHERVEAYVMEVFGPDKPCEHYDRLVGKYVTQRGGQQ